MYNKSKRGRNGKDGRRREDDVTRNCLLYQYLKIVLSLSIANLKSCILHCVTIGKKWSTVFKLYAKTCLYFFLFFSDGRNIIGLHIAVAAACSVGVFGRRKLIHFCIFVATIFNFMIKEDWETPHFLLCFGLSTWHFREQKLLPAQRKLLHCRLVYTVYI